MRSRDRRTKRDAAFRRGGIYAPKALKEAPPHSCPWAGMGERQIPIICVNFCCPLSWVRFYFPVQTLGSMQINMSLTRGTVPPDGRLVGHKTLTDWRAICIFLKCERFFTLPSINRTPNNLLCHSINDFISASMASE